MNSNERDVNINSELLISKPLPDNRWTYTLTSRLGDMLYLAEKLFGPRDLSYTPLGIEFVSDGPKVWFPGDSQQDRKHIAIRLDLVLLQIWRMHAINWHMRLFICLHQEAG